MDIKKLSNNINSNINKSELGQKPSEPASQKSPEDFVDKVSIENFSFRNNDQFFAKLELSKLNQESANHLKEMKTKISEYQQAQKTSPEAARETEVGQKINDPDVWDEIAQKMINL